MGVRPSGSAHGAGRSVTRRAGALAVLAVLAMVTAAGCEASTIGTGTLDPLAEPSPTGSSGNAGGSGESGAPSSGASPSATATGGPTSFHMLRFTLPPGWRIDTTASTACLDPPEATDGACTLRIVDYNTLMAAHQPGAPPQPKTQEGWWMGVGEPTCVPNQATPVVNSTLTDSSFVKMRNKTAAYGKWQVDCAGGLTITPRVWWLPVTKVGFTQHQGNAGPVDATVDQIIASVVVG